MTADTDIVAERPAAKIRGLMNVSGTQDLKKACAAAEGLAGDDAESAYLLGLFKYVGKGTQQDRKAASEEFAIATGMGSQEASIVAEEIGRNPEDVQERLMDLRFRAECRDLAACREIFPLYDTGKDGKGCKGPAKKNHAEAIRLYMPCADSGDADAQNTIGYMYLMGKGVAKDRGLALRLLESAWENGCAQAAYRIAYMYDSGQDFEDPDLDKAYEWYVKASDMGYADAEYALAGIMFMQDGPYRNVARGVKLLIKAADQGQHEAQQEAGMMYAYGSNGVKRDQEKAVKYLEAACEGGVQQAMTNYANMCFEGQAVPRDMAKAAKWFTKAAENYDGMAQYALGCMYGNGYYFDQDDSEAAKWFQEAAEGGEPNSQYALGCFYYEGRGIEKDEKKAAAWFQEAADQGHLGAMSFLGMFKITGKDVEQDIEGGLELLNVAAKNGYCEAQFYLGKLYADGEYVKQDLAYAKKMLSLAARQGDPDAEVMLQQLKKMKRR
ncbi:tetratricopeptide repeat protein [Methanomethylophilus alvi]|uniref:tetratricopeptide repeat protein n=1 Tax=Methanomethylophilus alvi TaxID=1291540 RepID=UPI0037DC7928